VLYYGRRGTPTTVRAIDAAAAVAAAASDAAAEQELGPQVGRR